MKRLAAGLLCMLTVGMVGPAGAASSPSDEPSQERWSLTGRMLKAAAPKRAAAPSGFLPSEIECTVRGRPDNLNLDCDDPVFESPNNEPDIEVDPKDPDHMIASSNDYESCCDEFYTTFNGGRTWTTGDMSAEDPNRIGSDPVTVFDPVSGNAIHASLNFLITEEGLGDDGDVVVSLSKDGGLTWGDPVVVGEGIGDDDDPLQIFNDKEWIVTDTNPDSPYYGRTYLTWTAFRSRLGVYTESPIFEAHSDDGGVTWTEPQEISGSDPTCTYQETGRGRQCDEDQFSVPTVGPDGTLYVAFENAQHEAAWEAGEVFESQYMVVRSTDGGESFSGPVSVVDLEDGTRDYPVNVNDRQTLTDYQIRVNSAGNIVASPANGKLYIVFSDNRDGVHDADRPVTDTNVYVMTSKDGIHWRGPLDVADRPGDQWFPWAEVNPANGEVGVIYHDRPVPRGSSYATTLSEGRPGHWRHDVITSERSHPRNSLYFRARVKGCFKCATFHGDYIGLDYGSDGSANLAWTDMSRLIEFEDTIGYTENIFFSRR